MGCIFSYYKDRNEYNETLLTHKKYCFQCGKMLTQKEYDKHIPNLSKKAVKWYRQS